MVHFYVLHTTDHLGMRNNILRVASKSRIALSSLGTGAFLQKSVNFISFISDYYFIFMLA